MILLIKIVVTAIALVSVAKSYLDYRKRREPLVMFLFWTIVWVAAIIIIDYPLLIDTVIAYSRDKSVTVGSITAAAFVFVLFIVYRIYTKVARLEYYQSELIRKLGLAREFKKSAKANESR